MQTLRNERRNDTVREVLACANEVDTVEQEQPGTANALSDGRSSEILHIKRNQERTVMAKGFMGSLIWAFFLFTMLKLGVASAPESIKTIPGISLLLGKGIPLHVGFVSALFYMFVLSHVPTDAVIGGWRTRDARIGILYGAWAGTWYGLFGYCAVQWAIPATALLKQNPLDLVVLFLLQIPVAIVLGWIAGISGCHWEKQSTSKKRND